MQYKIRRPLRASKQRYYAFVIPDCHLGYHQRIPTCDPLVWDLGMQALKHSLKRMTHLIILGDFGNCEGFSHWSALRAEQVYIEEDIAIMNARLDEIDKICDVRNIKKVFIMGNHEEWSTLIEAKYPFLRNEINLNIRLFKTRKNWTVVPNNHFFKLGKAYYTHGNIRGVKNPEDMIKKTGHSVFYGHTHGCETKNLRMLESEHTAATCGCWAMIDPPPAYSKAWVPERWVHALNFTQIRANGLFQHESRRIIESSYTELGDGTEIIADSKAAKVRFDDDMRLLDRLEENYRDRYYRPEGNVHEAKEVGGWEPLRGTERRSRQQRARIISS